MNTSRQPCSCSRSRTRIAQSLFRLEWLMNRMPTAQSTRPDPPELRTPPMDLQDVRGEQSAGPVPEKSQSGEYLSVCPSFFDAVV